MLNHINYGYSKNQFEQLDGFKTPLNKLSLVAVPNLASLTILPQVNLYAWKVLLVGLEVWNHQQYGTTPQKYFNSTAKGSEN